MVFYVDAKVPKDVTTITLSYTFFEVGGKVPPAPEGGLKSNAAAAAAAAATAATALPRT